MMLLTRDQMIAALARNDFPLDCGLAHRALSGLSVWLDNDVEMRLDPREVGAASGSDAQPAPTRDTGDIVAELMAARREGREPAEWARVATAPRGRLSPTERRPGESQTELAKRIIGGRR